MPVSASDIKIRKSEFVNNTSSNGGRKGYVEAVSGQRYAHFPRVTANECLNGTTKYRKFFVSNENTEENAANAMEIYLNFPSNGGDSIQLASGSQINTQADIVLSGGVPTFTGSGQLNSALATTDTEVEIIMEDDEIEFLNGGNLYVSDKYATSQTIDSDVKIGDSVEYNEVSEQWEKITATDDYTYPNGIYIGNSVVMTLEEESQEEFIELADNLYEDEVIGTGDGTTSVELSTLTYNTNGICKQTDKRPVVTALHSSSPMTVTVNKDGSCSGDCTAGQLNMETGVWTEDIVFSDTIDNATDVTITYHENCFSYSGNVCTVELAANPTNNYSADNTYACGCISIGDLEPLSDSWAETSVAGTYDESSYPVELFNLGAVEDIFTITFTSASTFTCSGANEGSLGTGSISSDFSPVNANTGEKYFTIDKDGWGGTWATNDTVVFATHPSAGGFWLKEVIPAETSQVTNNLIILGFYCE